MLLLKAFQLRHDPGSETLSIERDEVISTIFEVIKLFQVSAQISRNKGETDCRCWKGKTHNEKKGR